VSSLLPDPLRDPDAPPRALVEALRQEPIEPSRIERAYGRFSRRRAAVSARPWGPRLVRYVALAGLMAVGTVYAATLVRRHEPPALPPIDAPKAPPRPVAPPRPAITVGGEASPKDEPKSVAAAPPEMALRERPARSPAPATSAEQWRRAAQGLRDGDYRTADAALKELARRGTEAERESALLVQAQVLLAQGRQAEAQSLLKSLVGSARAPSVRRKSVELLDRLRARPATRGEPSRSAKEPPP
jgi:hypothetical protein